MRTLLNSRTLNLANSHKYFKYLTFLSLNEKSYLCLSLQESKSLISFSITMSPKSLNYLVTTATSLHK